MASGQDIPLEIALKLCEEIRTENKTKWYLPWHSMCYFCYRFSGGNAEKMCLAGGGCIQINHRYERRHKKKGSEGKSD